MLAHSFAGFDRHVKVTAQIDFQGFLEGRDRCVQNVAIVRVSGRVVDQDINPGMRVIYIVEKRFDLLYMPHVTGSRFRASARGLDVISDCLTALKPSARAYNMRAVIGQDFCYRLANSATGTPDDGHSAVKIKMISSHEFRLACWKEPAIISG